MRCCIWDCAVAPQLRKTMNDELRTKDFQGLRAPGLVILRSQFSVQQVSFLRWRMFRVLEQPLRMPRPAPVTQPHLEGSVLVVFEGMGQQLGRLGFLALIDESFGETALVFPGGHAFFKVAA